METSRDILDSPEIIDQEVEELMVASAGKRLSNLLMDYFFFTLFVVILAVVLSFWMTPEQIEAKSDYLWLGIYALYLICFEYFFGKTPAKFITGTRVVTEEGEKPGLAAIVIRTLCRFIPFEAFSFLNEDAIGWHDKFSGTFVVNDR